MAEHDYVIANQNGANTRSDLNNALAAIVSNNSKATAPTTTYAFMWWADTANDILKQRNAADSAWINILTLSTGAPLGTLGLDSSGGVARATSGLLFNADTAAANTLDDYEEGSWTATIGDGTNIVTLSTNVCRYIKVGKKVTLFGRVVTSSLGSVTGNLRISGLPFPAATVYGVLTAGVTAGLSSTAGYNITGDLVSGNSHISLYRWSTALGVSALTSTQWSADGQMRFEITYQAT